MKNNKHLIKKFSIKFNEEYFIVLLGSKYPEWFIFKLKSNESESITTINELLIQHILWKQISITQK